MPSKFNKVFLSLLSFVALFAAGAARAVERVETVPVDAFFRYDKNLPFKEEIKLERETPFTKTELVWYDSVHDKRVPAILTVPKKGGPFPVIVFMHGYGMKKDLGPMADNMIGSKGYALFAIDTEYRNERSVEGKDIFNQYVYSSRDAFVQTIVDVMRGIDYLETRPEIDKNRMGILGLSMGTFIGSTVYSIDPRLRCATFGVGGANFLEAGGKSLFSPAKRMLAQVGGVSGLEEAKEKPGIMALVQEAIAPMDPINFVHRTKGRFTLMANGRLDELVPPDMAWELYNHLGEPKHIEWFDGGHVPSIETIMDLVNTMVDWFNDYLKPERVHRVPLEQNQPPVIQEFTVDAPPEGVRQDQYLTATVKADDPNKDIAFAKVFAPCGGFEIKLEDSGKGLDKAKGDGVFTGKARVFERTALGPCRLEAAAVDRWGETSEKLYRDVNILEIQYPEGALPPIVDELSVPEKIVPGEKFTYRIKASDPNGDLDQIVFGVRELGLTLSMPLSSDGVLEDSLEIPEEFLELMPPGTYHLTAKAKDKAKLYSEEKSIAVEVTPAM